MGSIRPGGLLVGYAFVKSVDAFNRALGETGPVFKTTLPRKKCRNHNKKIFVDVKHVSRGVRAEFELGFLWGEAYEGLSEATALWGAHGP